LYNAEATIRFAATIPQSCDSQTGMILTLK